MKKSLIILLVLGVLLTLGLASCKNEVQAPADELVSVSFEQAVSRALTATLQEFKKENYYWYYAAKKADSTGLISGQTTTYTVADAVAVKKDGTKGLDGQVPGFSQGSWDFLLFAYEEDPEATGATITKADYTYWGEATAVVLKKNGANTVSVTVNPAEQGQGTLFVDMEHIKLSEASSASHNTVAPLVSISCGEKTYEIEAGSNIKYKVDAGQWIVKVEYTDGDIIFATGTVLATVYPRLTTIVTGDVSELITYAQFDAKENPDLVKVTAGSTATAYDAIPSAGVVLSGTDEGETKTVSTTVAKGDAQKIMAEMATNAGVGLDSNTKMSLALNVDPTAATETSITYDISMSATLSVTQGSETKSTVKDVDKLDNVVIVEISMQKDLQDVEVWHKTTKMTRVDSKDDLADGKFYYDAENGKLYICTSTFSPFSISYKFIEYAASLNGKKYETLAEAFNAAVESEKKSTIYLLKDASGKGIFLAQNLGADITVDLCGYTYTCTGPAVGSKGTENQAFHLEKGNTVTIKNGTITSDAEAISGVKMLVQNYSNLTLENVVLDGTKLAASSSRYVLSNNCGEVLICGTTSITAPAGGYALDAYDWREKYPEGVSITIDTTGTINGWIQLDGDAVSEQPYRNSIVIKNGIFMNFAAYQIKVGKFSVEGGTFYNWNPTGGPLAEGYVAIEIEKDVWKVVPAVAKISDKYYASVAAAVAASEAGDTVIVLRDTVETSTINVNENITIQGVDPENLVSVRKNSARLFNIESSATIKDLSLYASDEPIYVVIESDEVVDLNNLNIDSGFKSIHVLSSGTVNVRDCISSGVYPTNLNVSNKYNALTFKAVDSEFYGWISWGTGTEEITFTNCSFGAGHGYSHMRPYVATTFDNCTFYGMTMDTHPDNISGVISFNSCTYVKDAESTSIVDKDSLLLLLDAGYVRGKMAWKVDGNIVIDDRPTE